MVLTFLALKGGVAKSTTAINVAAELVARGRSVLLVDADPQSTARTWADVAAESGLPAPTCVAMGATMHRPGQLDRLAESHDWIVIDTPPRLGDVARSSCMVADLAVVPCGPSPVDAWAAAATLELVAEAQTVRPFECRLLITRKAPGTVLGRGARDVLSDAGVSVLSSELCYRVAYQEALGAGMGVTRYAPRSAAAAEVRALVDELEKDGKRCRRNRACP